MSTYFHFRFRLYQICLLAGLCLLSEQGVGGEKGAPPTTPGYPWCAEDYICAEIQPVSRYDVPDVLGSDCEQLYRAQEAEYRRWDPQIGRLLPGCGRSLPQSDESWSWHGLPQGILFRAYFASNRETRIGAQIVHESEQNSNYWDPTIGGRFGLIRFGNTSRLYPEGFQLDLECAVLSRLTVDHHRDVTGSDYRFALPLTYRCGALEWKFGYLHVSSHMGDEWIARNFEKTGQVFRINYVRDCLAFGMAYRPDANWRFFLGCDCALGTGGGAKPWLFELGCEYSPILMPGPEGSPFWALYLRWKEETDYDTYVAFECGWQWKALYQATFRTGLYMMSGSTDQRQFYARKETQVGFGLWYDY